MTGYWPVMGCSFAVFTREGRVCVILPEDELELAQATSNAEFIAYKAGTLDRLTNPAKALLAPVKELFASFHFANGLIGTELEDGAQAVAYQSANHFRSSIVPLLHQAHPGNTVVAADTLIEHLKAVKTTVEIDLLRHASRLAAAGFGEAIQAIVRGRREDEVAADIDAAFARIANDGFERGKGYFFCMSGPNSFKAAGAYARTRSRILEEGDLVMIHANTVGDGYWTDITRTYIVGEPSADQQRMQAAIAEARQAALKVISPGTPAATVDAEARGVLTKHGFGHAFKHATGHGVGFAAAYSNTFSPHPSSFPRHAGEWNDFQHRTSYLHRGPRRNATLRCGGMYQLRSGNSYGFLNRREPPVNS